MLRQYGLSSGTIRRHERPRLMRMPLGGCHVGRQIARVFSTSGMTTFGQASTGFERFVSSEMGGFDHGMPEVPGPNGSGSVRRH